MDSIQRKEIALYPTQEVIDSLDALLAENTTGPYENRKRFDEVIV